MPRSLRSCASRGSGNDAASVHRTYDTRQTRSRRSLRPRPPLFLKFAKEAAEVSRIVRDVAARGDAALVDHVRRLDWPDATPERFEVPREEIDTAYDSLPDDQRRALVKACERVRRFHERCLPRSWIEREAGRTLGQRWIPLRRVGIYVLAEPRYRALFMCTAPPGWPASTRS